MRGSHYGRLHVLEHPEAASIWRTRDKEPTACEVIEPSPDDYQEPRLGALLARQLVEQIEQRLSQREMLVLLGRFVVGWTLDEMAARMNLCTARVGQIEAKAIKKARVGLAFDCHLLN